MSGEFDNLLVAAAKSFERLRSSRFQRMEEIGRGGMSVVYRAVDRKLAREVALKCLRTDTQSDPEALARFHREARVAAGLHHPNIVTVFDACEEGGRMSIVMEYVEGRPLSAILGSRAYETRGMLTLLEKAARGAAAAHAGGIVHRDLKPANILVTRDGEPKVVDFGLALVLDLDSTRITQAGSSMGTPAYMAPEQAEGRSREISTRTDVYGLGAILYEILTGRPPHTGETIQEIFARIVREDPIRPRRINRLVNPEVEAICLKALEREPARRYADAKEFADDLQNHLEGRPVRARIAGPLGQALKWMRRHRGFSAVAAVVFLSLALWTGDRAVRSARLRSLESRAQTARYPEERARLLEEAIALAPDDESLRLRWQKARKRADAVRLAAEADRALKEQEKVEDQIVRLERDLEKLERETKHWAREKAELWRLRAEIDSLQKKAAELDSQVLGSYARAAGIDPEFMPPRRFLAEWHWKEFEIAERASDSEEMASHLSSVRQYDDGRFERRLVAPGSLRIEADPPGARAVLWTFVTADDRRLVPSSPRELGACPVEIPSLPQDSYLVTLTLEGFAEVRCPVRIRRGTAHRAAVKMLLPGEIGDGFVYVPGGEMIFGEKDETALREVKSFTIARHETTWAEFVAYLNDRLGSGAEARMNSKPAAARPEWHAKDGRIIIVSGGDRPACGVTWDEASDYCEWRSERDPEADYRLPRILEWERAARGADGRRFPWGNDFDWSFTNGARSQKGKPGSVAVGSFPKDESVFGVRDMAGNAEEWCADDYDEELDLKHCRGGGWDSAGPEDFGLGESSGDKPFIVEHSKGFRVVRVPSK